jgi:hypothetical protein
MIEAIKVYLETTYNEKIEVNMIDTNVSVIDGHKALKYTYEYTINDIHVIQTQFIIKNGNMYDMVLISDFKDGHTDIFKDCIEKFEYISKESN